jgi:hypothetical protein
MEIPCGPFREGCQNNRLRRYAVEEEQPQRAEDENFSLPGAGPGEDPEGSAISEDGLFLLRVGPIAYNTFERGEKVGTIGHRYLHPIYP